jgi:hypothetical protein
VASQLEAWSEEKVCIYTVGSEGEISVVSAEIFFVCVLGCFFGLGLESFVTVS